MTNTNTTETADTNSPTLAEIFGGNVIHTYTRAQAIADGELVACSEPLARNAGFLRPLAFTRAVEALITQIPARYSHEDETGRRWDVLFMAMLAARRNRDETLFSFRVIVHHDVPSLAAAEHTHELFLQLGPGDDGAPVFTVMTAMDL